MQGLALLQTYNMLGKNAEIGEIFLHSIIATWWHKTKLRLGGEDMCDTWRFDDCGIQENPEMIT